MGTNQRAAIQMSAAEIDEFLHERRTMSMATIGPDGRVQLVAMWYGFDGDDIVFETKAKSQKVANLRRDPRLTVMVEAGDSYDELRGVELVGTGELIDDPGTLWRVAVSVWERYQGPYSEDVRPLVEAMTRKRVAVRLRAERVVSWDHRKLGGPVG